MQREMKTKEIQEEVSPCLFHHEGIDMLFFDYELWSNWYERG